MYVDVKPHFTIKPKERNGLLVIDLVNGFCKVGAGNLAPKVENKQIDKMIYWVDIWMGNISFYDQPIFMFQDCHDPDQEEPPFPEHCVRGSGEELIIDQLQKYLSKRNVTVMEKNAINGVVAAYDPVTGRNKFYDWVNEQELETLIVQGICTDICVMNAVLSILSARNAGLLPTLKQVVVHEQGCATYDLPEETVRALDLPRSATHDQMLLHDAGLYFMQLHGAIIAERLFID